MEKRYFRNSFGSLIFQAIIICGLLLDIYASILCTVILSVNGINSDTDVLIFAIFVFYLGIPMLIYIELTFLIGDIILNNQITSCRPCRPCRPYLELQVQLEQQVLACQQSHIQWSRTYQQSMQHFQVQHELPLQGR